ncbi:uncharacterized protein AFUA_6G11090 [Aspergillus fumigatus Af293]|uniref:Uncharacterized protein n=2 Tax=Aspergillus fumigatus TaxID=746128 RepID=Q4WM59_ASPFU|nr:conserved hypothetical protein [Aspergillus fumigatus Af293]EAL88955.1 conserved hypothetical protein [Aspergillus fumigatus Af293]EDP49681.1 conserved hypothetical protein [Aspergillus fumigatus A1163]
MQREDSSAKKRFSPSPDRCQAPEPRLGIYLRQKAVGQVLFG